MFPYYLLMFVFALFIADIRTNRLLTECFDSKTQQFIVQHVETTRSL